MSMYMSMYHRTIESINNCSDLSEIYQCVKEVQSAILLNLLDIQGLDEVEIEEISKLLLQRDTSTPKLNCLLAVASGQVTISALKLAIDDSDLMRCIDDVGVSESCINEFHRRASIYTPKLYAIHGTLSNRILELTGDVTRFMELVEGNKTN